MERDQGVPGCELLKGYRVLDFTDDKGALCGKMFADLGADVIKIEPPGGCPTRRIPPFLEDVPGPDRSLYFLAYQAGKRSVTLNLGSADGRALLTELVRKSDFLVESFPLGHLDTIGLGYEDLSKVNPRIIYASITPFGDNGPGKNWKAADITAWAAGGMMFLMGDEERPPLQIGLPQAGLHAGAEAAAASLIAHVPRERTGRGQKVVVDMQACVAWTLMNEQAFPILHGDYLRRHGIDSLALGIRRKTLYRCADGYISCLPAGGPGVGSKSTIALVAWMDEKGFASEWMKTNDWAAWTPGRTMEITDDEKREILDLEDRIERFFMTMGRREIYQNGLKRRILLAPVATAEDIAADEQLKARDFFQKVTYPGLGRELVLPGPFAKYSRTPIGVPGASPRLGEHNREVYCDLVGISAERLEQLRATGAI